MSWKDHPIPVAAVTCVATLGVCYKLLIPVYTSTLEDEVLRKGKQISELQEKLSTAIEKNKKLEIENSTLISDAVLKFCNPYPINLDYVKIGDLLQEVVSKYSDPKYDLENNKSYMFVKFPGNKVVEAASYIAIDGEKINSIIFFYKDVELPRGKQKLQESPQQLGLLKQVKDAFPNALIVKRNDQADPGYDVTLRGNKILSVDPTGFSIRAAPSAFRDCNK